MTELSLRFTGADKVLAQVKEDFSFYSSLTAGLPELDDDICKGLRQKVLDDIETLEGKLFVPELLTTDKLLDAESATLLRDFMLFAAFDAKGLIGDEEAVRLQDRYKKVVSRQQELRDVVDRTAFARSLRSSDA